MGGMAKALSPRTYLTESAVGLCTGYMAMLPPDQLHADGEMSADFAAALENFHIYLIGRRPALAIDPTTFIYEGGTARGDLIYRVNGEVSRAAFCIEHPVPQETEQVVVAPYPHRQYQALDASGEILVYWPTLTMPSFDRVRYGLDELDIVYIGQAFGDGTRNALDRLRSHSTLQKILADTAAKRPDEELVIVLAHYTDYQIFSTIDGRAKNAILDDRDKDRWLNLLDNPLSEKNQISLAEAALIRYFRPIYNEIYKGSFPKEDQKILDDCYRLDFSGLVVEINSEDLGIYLKSTHMRRGMHHIAKFDLHDTAKRRSFFALTDAENKLVATLNEGGPVY